MVNAGHAEAPHVTYTLVNHVKQARQTSAQSPADDSRKLGALAAKWLATVRKHSGDSRKLSARSRRNSADLCSDSGDTVDAFSLEVTVDALSLAASAKLRAQQTTP